MSDYRAITVKRVWAERIGNGSKMYEVRRFTTPYRGPLVITISGEKVAYCTVWLRNVFPSSDVAYGANLTPEELAFGKFAWLLLDAKRCEPVPCKGKLGLWHWDGELPRVLEMQS